MTDSAMTGRLVCIFGPSGVGKSEICRRLESLAKFKNTTFIHQDDYFVKNKPFYTLSNGKRVKNWDCPEAIDFIRLNMDISTALTKYNLVVLDGFMLRDDLLSYKPDIMIHLSYIVHTTISSNTVRQYIDLITNRMIEARRKSKGNIRNGDLIVLEMVIPAYMASIDHTTIHHNIPTFDDSADRVAIDVICGLVIALLV